MVQKLCCHRVIISDDQCVFGCDFGRNDAHECQDIFIKSHHGKYVVAEPNEKVNHFRTEIGGEWDCWKVTFVGKDRVTLKSNRYVKKYLRAEIDGTVKADRDKAGNYEVWTVKVLPGEGLFTFKSYHGQYLSAELFGALNANRCLAKEWETFEIIPIPKGKRIFRRAYSFRPTILCRDQIKLYFSMKTNVDFP